MITRAAFVAPFPADELILFGPAILGHAKWDWTGVLIFDRWRDFAFGKIDSWKSSCQALGVKHTCEISFPLVNESQLSLEHLIDTLQDALEGYDRVYVPDVTSDGYEAIVATAAASVGKDYIWSVTFNGVPDEVLTYTHSQWNDIISLANTNYADGIASELLLPRMLLSVRAYRCISSISIARFNAQFLNWDTPLGSGKDSISPNDHDPWDLGTSEYEQMRHEAELDVLRKLEWSTLCEVGSCIGVFTEKILRRFDDKSITCIEPVHHFASKLKQKLGNQVELLIIPANEVEKEFDVVFLSSCLYYMKKWPHRIISHAGNYVVTSHRRLYEEKVVRPAMLSEGWRLYFEKEVSACFERFCELVVEKDGTLISVWTR